MRFADFRTISRSLTLPEPTNVTQELLEAGLELLTRRLPPRHLPVRLLGFGANGLDNSGESQRQLFDQPERSVISNWTAWPTRLPPDLASRPFAGPLGRKMPINRARTR